MASRKAEIILEFELTKAKNELAAIESRMARTTNKAGKEWDKLEKEHERVATKIGDAEEKAAEKAKKAAEDAAKGREKKIQAVTDKMKLLGKSIAGVVIALGSAAVAFAAVGVKNNLQDATNYRKSMHDLENQQKRLAMQTNALGYITDETRSRFIDMQIEAEKLAWQNRFVTQTNREFEAGISALSVGFTTVQGAMSDMVQESTVSLLPTLDDIESALQEYVAPALAFCATAFTNWKDIVEVAMASAEIALKKGVEGFVYFFHDYIPALFVYMSENLPKILLELGGNILKIFQNIGDNIFAAFNWLVDQIYSILPPGVQDAFSDVRTIFDNFLHNCNEFVGTLIVGFCSIPDRLTVFGQNFVQFFKNLYSKISAIWDKMKSAFSWDAWKTWWNGEGKGKTDEIDANANGLTAGFKKYEGVKFGEGAKYRNLLDGIVTDKEREERRQEREQNRPGFKSLGEGVTWGAWGNFKTPEITYKADTSEAEKRMADAQKRIAAGYASNLASTQGIIARNFAKARDKVNPEVQPVGDWELFKLLEGSQKASTENVTSAYDRINNAVANKNPVVEMMKKQLDEQKKQADEQKTVEEKKVEKQSETAAKTAESATSLDKIYNLLASWHLPQAAVVEG